MQWGVLKPWGFQAAARCRHSRNRLTSSGISSACFASSALSFAVISPVDYCAPNLATKGQPSPTGSAIRRANGDGRIRGELGAQMPASADSCRSLSKSNPSKVVPKTPRFLTLPSQCPRAAIDPLRSYRSMQPTVRCSALPVTHRLTADLVRVATSSGRF